MRQLTTDTRSGRLGSITGSGRIIA